MYIHNNAVLALRALHFTGLPTLTRISRHTPFLTQTFAFAFSSLLLLFFSPNFRWASGLGRRTSQGNTFTDCQSTLYWNTLNK